MIRNIVEQFKNNLDSEINNTELYYEKVIYKLLYITNELSETTKFSINFEYYNTILGYTILNFIKHQILNNNLPKIIELTALGMWNYNLYASYIKKTSNNSIIFPNECIFFRLNQVILFIEKNIDHKIKKTSSYNDFVEYVSKFNKIYCKLTRASEEDCNLSGDEYELCTTDKGFESEILTFQQQNTNNFMNDIDLYISDYEKSYIKIENIMNIKLIKWKYSLKWREYIFLKMSKFVQVTNYPFRQKYKFNIDSAKCIFFDLFPHDNKKMEKPDLLPHDNKKIEKPEKNKTHVKSSNYFDLLSNLDN